MNVSIVVVFMILAASLCGLAYAANEATRLANEKLGNPDQQQQGQERPIRVTGGSGGGGQSVEDILNPQSEEAVARKNKDLRERTEKLMVKHCGNIETTLGLWAATVRKEVPKDDYATASHVLHGQIKAAAIQGKTPFIFSVKNEELTRQAKDESGVLSSFLKNASNACASVPKNKGDGRLSSFWFLPCMTMYRRKYHSVPRPEHDPETKQIASYLRFDGEIEQKLASLDTIMACPKLVVDLAGKQLDHEYLVEGVDKLIAQGTLSKEKRPDLLAKLGPFPTELSQVVTVSHEKKAEHDEL
jgi:hypothetical protein